MVLEACGEQQQARARTATAAGGGSRAPPRVFGSSKSYKFTFVNHVTTNPFFTPTQNGAADACKLLGCSYQWTGSAEQQRRRDGQRVQQRGQRRRRRDRGRADRPDRVQRADVQKALGGEDPGRRLQRRRRRQRAPGLHRPGPVRVRAGDGRAHRLAGAVGRRRAVHRDARARSTSSRGSTARRTRSSRIPAITPHVVATGAARAGRS